MASDEHLQKLREGTAAWNAWREAYPAVHPDLSDLDLSRDEKTHHYSLVEDTAQGRAVNGINFRDTNLQSAKLEHLVFLRPDFRGADLSGGSINHSKFIEGWFAVGLQAIEERRGTTGTLNQKDIRDFRNQACRLARTTAYGATFKAFSLSFADLTTIKVDEATRFEQVGVVGTKISRATLDMLVDYGGLSAGRRSQMIIFDDVATLRQSFSGFWNAIHIGALVVFLLPYAWFLVSQWLRARVGEALPTNTDTSSILSNLCKFVVSGGSTWRQWSPGFLPILLFAIAIVFNLARGILFLKTKQLEHQHSVTGLHSNFRLQGLWAFTLIAYKALAIVGIGIVLAHTLMFLLKPVPL
jgi:hypothetical protein